MGEEGESEKGEGGINPSHPTLLTSSFKMGEMLQRAEAGDERLMISLFLFFLFMFLLLMNKSLMYLFWPLTKRG